MSEITTIQSPKPPGNQRPISPRPQSVLASMAGYGDLFMGRLAVAEGLIAREELAELLRQRAGRPLSQRLLESGRIDEPTRDLIDHCLIAMPTHEEVPLRFDLLRVMGSSASWLVFSAWDCDRELPVYLYVPGKGHPRPDCAGLPLGQLAHPNLLGVTERLAAGERALLVAEGMPPRTASSILRDARRPVRERVALLEQAARGLAAAHAAGIHHLNLAPERILIDDRGAPRLTECGLAQLAGTGRGFTARGEFIGSAGYMAPEQVDTGGGAVDARTDVYGLGAMLYEVLVGKPPHLATSIADAFDRILHQRVPRPRSLVPDVDRGLEAVCLKALATDPGRRYPDAGALADDLARCLAGRAPRARSRLVRWLGLGGALLAALALAHRNLA